MRSAARVGVAVEKEDAGNNAEGYDDGLEAAYVMHMLMEAWDTMRENE